jgi:hypothetical protein
VTRLLEVVATVGVGLLAGIMVAAAIIIHPVIGTMDQEPGKLLQQRGATVGWWLGPKVGVVCAVCMLATIALGDRPAEAQVLTAAALAAFFAAVWFTRLYEAPELAMRKLPIGSSQEVFTATFHRMRSLHRIRTVFFVLSFVLATVGVALD